MARPKGSKNKPTLKLGEGSRFKTWEGIHPKDKHVRLTDYMMRSREYKSLSSSAKVLYMYMKLAACGNETVEYAISYAKGFMSAPTFCKARDDLVEKGFIEYVNRHCARDLREMAEYKFSTKWIGRANASK